MDSRYFTVEHEAFRKTVRDFVEKELVPHIDEWEEKEEMPREIFPRMGQLGFFGLRFPEEYGGSGVDFFFSVIFAEELARCGVEMVFLQAPSGASPEDHLLAQFQGMIAEYERAQILERSRRGKRHRAKQSH